MVPRAETELEPKPLLIVDTGSEVLVQPQVDVGKVTDVVDVPDLLPDCRLA